MTRPVLTIGHSTHPIAEFLVMLAKSKVTAIADVRSSPHSRFNPQYNRESLKRALTDAGICYVFLGKELGARSNDSSVYQNGKVQYHELARAPLFQQGIARVIEGAKTHGVALMCAEKEPLDCHRTILVARELAGRGIDIQHILADGSLESHEHAMCRLMDELGIPSQDMF